MLGQTGLVAGHQLLVQGVSEYHHLTLDCVNQTLFGRERGDKSGGRGFTLI